MSNPNRPFVDNNLTAPYSCREFLIVAGNSWKIGKNNAFRRIVCVPIDLQFHLNWFAFSKLIRKMYVTELSATLDYIPTYFFIYNLIEFSLSCSEFRPFSLTFIRKPMQCDVTQSTYVMIEFSITDINGLLKAQVCTLRAQRVITNSGDL